ncbi:penicillin-binding protein 3 [Salmonella enterica subsp. arizonae]|nr:penicillin-binding protein 3 [Salmonella enterica subsp. arizonae]
MRNRTITDVFEPGSTVKPMVVMTALQRGIVNENTVLNTVPYRINGHENQRRGALQRINPDRGSTEVE